MDFLQFHNLSGGWESFFAQDVKRVGQLEIQLPNGERALVTQVIFGAGSVMLREPYDEVMAKIASAWGVQVA